MPGALAKVFTVNCTEVAPEGIVTVAGTVATLVLLLESFTTNPAAGATPEIVTVPVDEAGCVTLVELNVSLVSVGGFTVSVALTVAPPAAAEIEGVACALTGLVVTVNVADFAPAATVRLAGTVAADVLLLARVTVNPPVGAAAFNCTVPFDEVLPITVVGFKVTEETAGGFTVNAVFCVTPNVPEILAFEVAATAWPVTVKVAVVFPAATVTDDGTVAAAVLSLDRATESPPVAAGPLRVTVPVELLSPPVTLVGLKEIEDTTGGCTVSVAV